jgi:periplasmic divalent cation tolerance protein
MTDAEEFCQVAVTFDDRAEAEKLLTQIVSERLAACAQVSGPIASTYWWQGKIETTEEWSVDFKTCTRLLDSLTARVTELHSYDTPQIVAVPIVGGLADYLTWIRDETTDNQPTRKVAAAE